MERVMKRDQEYNGVMVKAGEKFTLVEPQHAIALIAAGAIDPEPGEPGYVEPSARPAQQPARRRRG